jgi:hypothetical protein
MSSKSNFPSLGEVARNPLTIVIGSLSTLAHLGQYPIIDPLIGTLWSQSGTIFTATSVLATTLAPRIPWLPVEFFQVATMVVGVIFVASIASKVWDNYQQQSED